MITKQEMTTVGGVSVTSMANFWVDWGKPGLEAGILILSFIALIMLVWSRYLDIRQKRKNYD